VIIVGQKIFYPELAVVPTLAVDTIASFIVTLAIGFYTKPTDMDVLVKFYSKVRPFGFWKPVRLEAERRGLIPVNDPMPRIDILNGFLTMFFQVGLALTPFYLFLREWPALIGSAIGVLVLGVVLYFTWYKNLPSKDEV
jgi:SSS family solute:Na+ symporter